MEWINEKLELSEKSWYLTHKNLRELIENTIYAPKLGVEIGVAFGSNSYKLLKNFKELTLYSLDPYVKYSDTDSMSKLTEGENGDNLYNFVFNRLNNSYGDRSKLVRSDSSYLINNIEDNSLDFVFIDGDHSYEGVKIDIENSFSKVKSGGLISGDDYGLIPTVDLAVNEFCNKTNIKINVKDLVWWFIKP